MSVMCWTVGYTEQEAQLMLTNPCDTFRGQSRSSNVVPFDMLGMVSYYCTEQHERQCMSRAEERKDGMTKSARHGYTGEKWTDGGQQRTDDRQKAAITGQHKWPGHCLPS